MKFAIIKEANLNRKYLENLITNPELNLLVQNFSDEHLFLFFSLLNQISCDRTLAIFLEDNNPERVNELPELVNSWSRADFHKTSEFFYGTCPIDSQPLSSSKSVSSITDSSTHSTPTESLTSSLFSFQTQSQSGKQLELLARGVKALETISYQLELVRKQQEIHETEMRLDKLHEMNRQAEIEIEAKKTEKKEEAHFNRVIRPAMFS